MFKTNYFFPYNQADGGLYKINLQSITYCYNLYKIIVLNIIFFKLLFLLIELNDSKKA